MRDYEVTVETLAEQPIAAARQRTTFQRIWKEIGTLLNGPWAFVRSAHDAVGEWCKRNGLETAMPFWEIYCDWEDDPVKLRTDVLYLLKSAG
jgi:effector-binding domain-containing protein